MRCGISAPRFLIFISFGLQVLKAYGIKHMKKIFFVFVALLAYVQVSAQESPWLFRTVNEIHGKEIFITRMNSKEQERLNKEALLSMNGKYKKFNKVKGFNYVISNNIYSVGQPVEIKGKSYVCLGNERISVYLSMTYLSEILYSHILSVTYLDNEIKRYRDDYAYLDYNCIKDDSYTKNKLHLYYFYRNAAVLDKYIPVDWISYRPNSVDNPFVITLKASRDTVTLAYRELQELLQKNCLVKRSLVDSAVQVQKHKEEEARKEQERQDSIRNTRVQYCVVKTDHSIKCQGEGEIEVEKGDTIALVQYEPSVDRFFGLYNFKGVMLNDHSYSFYYDIDNLDMDYLKRKATTTDDQRFERARIDDSLRSERKLARVLRDIDSLTRVIDSIQKNLNRRQIFMISQDYAYGKYDQFGLEFNLYNCFTKSIKYVQITVVPYNQVNDVQCDDVGRREKNVRCIGPIEPKEKATFTFDELFWDENDIIKYLRVTYIKFTFMDNSTKVYSGWDNIKKHYN